MLAEFGVQAGKESYIDSPNPKAGLDFKRSSKDWIPGQARLARDDTVDRLGGYLFWGWLIVSKRLDPGSSGACPG